MEMQVSDKIWAYLCYYSYLENKWNVFSDK